MSLSAISSLTPAASLQELQLAAPVQVSPKSSSASLPNDTVSLSPAAQKAAPSVDVDHDGDSH
jgi:hypothetical protein